jgi:hypothetical protein
MKVKISSVHTSRTIMFKELSDVMAQAEHAASYTEVLENNATGKSTRTNELKTNRYLRKLYEFDESSPAFKAFEYFWRTAGSADRPFLALLFALGNDDLLNRSVDIIKAASIGNRARVEDFEELIELHCPGNYSANTRKSAGQNLASSWKQAGYLEGKIKNIRVETNPGSFVVAFAMLLAYLDGCRGQFVMESKWVRALCIDQVRVRELAFEASRHDLLRFQSSGAVVTVSFGELFEKLNIDGVKN